MGGAGTGASRGPGGGGMGRGGGSRPAGPGPQATSNEEVARRLAERSDLVSAALRDTFRLMSPTQQTRAKELLDENDVTLPPDLTIEPTECPPDSTRALPTVSSCN